MWWPLWMALTGVLWGAAWAFGAVAISKALVAILLGLIAARLSAFSEIQWLWMMAIWVSVSVYLFSLGLYFAAAFAALSGTAYFTAWTSFLLADIAGVAMLLSLGGGIYVDAATSTRMADPGVSSRSGILGNWLHGHRGSSASAAKEKSR